MRRNLFFLFIFCGIVFLDQLSKYLIRHFGGFYICNRGMAFGVELYPIFFWIIWIAIIAIAGFQIFNYQFLIFNEFSISKFLNFKFWGLMLITSGAISNVIDRLHYGCVIDFIDLKFWPIFNLADIFIIVGAILLLIKLFKNNFNH